MSPFYLLAFGFIVTCMASNKLIRAPLYRYKQLSTGTLSNNGIPLRYARSGGQFYGKLSVGNPPQYFDVVYDTGSSDMWVFSSECNEPEYRSCSKYDHDASSTSSRVWFFRTFNILYGAGTAQGVWSKDDVTVAGITVHQQQFAEVTHTHFKTYMDIEGVLGLGFDGLAKGENTVMDNIMKQNEINPVVSFYMSSAVRGIDQVGEMVLGGSDPEHYVGELTYVPVTHAIWWQIQLDGLSFNGESVIPYIIKSQRPLLYWLMASHEVKKKAVPVIIDTGAQGFHGHPRILGRLLRALNKNMPCSEVNELPDIIFEFNGIQFPLRADKFYRDTGLGSCELMILESEERIGVDKNTLLLGQIFIEQYYTEFDFGNQRIGFAPSI